MDPLASFTFETFRARVGEDFRLEDAGVNLELIAADAAQVGEGTRAGGAFDLHFRGPLEPELQQGIQYVHHDDLGDFALFLVPIAREADGLRYEAAFN